MAQLTRKADNRLAEWVSVQRLTATKKHNEDKVALISKSFCELKGVLYEFTVSINGAGIRTETLITTEFMNDWLDHILEWNTDLEWQGDTHK